MGIYDREYYRREGPSYLASGQVCSWLLGINIVVFVLQLAVPDVTRFFILDPEEVLHGQIWRLLSYAFLHDPTTWQHIFFNMLFLWWFGSDMESLYGSKEFLAFYLVAATLGGVAYTAFDALTGQYSLCLGASGAVTAVLVLYAFHFPHQIIYIFLVLPVPIWLFVAFQVAQDTFLFLSQTRTTTAVTVHLAGAAFAAIYRKQHWHLTSLLGSMRSFRWRASRSRLRVYRPETEAEGEPVSVSAPTHGRELDEHLEAKLDAVLEKVARSGQSSLTESERQILLRASEIYKKKRT